MEIPISRPVHLEVEMLLSGMDFPATKKDVVDNAIEQDAPDWLMDLLQEIPETVYDSPAEVGRETEDVSNRM